MECKVWSVKSQLKSGERSVECKSVECEVWSVECKVSSVEFKVIEWKVRSGKCGV